MDHEGQICWEITMDSIINLQKKIVPELTNLLVQRYQILRQVSHEYPIGRRALAARLGLSERVLRAQVDFLKNGGLLAFSSAGMSVTAGEDLKYPGLHTNLMILKTRDVKELLVNIQVRRADTIAGRLTVTVVDRYTLLRCNSGEI